MLKPGTYRLARDVTNPSPDRRRTRDWRASPVWEKGEEFLVQAHSTTLTSERVGSIDYSTIVLVGDGRAREIGPGHSDQYQALESALVPVEESQEAMFTALGVRDMFARWLVESGKIQRDVFRALWEEYQGGEETDPIGCLSIGEKKAQSK